MGKAPRSFRSTTRRVKSRYTIVRENYSYVAEKMEFFQKIFSVELQLAESVARSRCKQRVRRRRFSSCKDEINPYFYRGYDEIFFNVRVRAIAAGRTASGGSIAYMRLRQDAPGPTMLQIKRLPEWEDEGAASRNQRRKKTATKAAPEGTAHESMKKAPKQPRISRNARGSSSRRASSLSSPSSSLVVSRISRINFRPLQEDRLSSRRKRYFTTLDANNPRRLLFLLHPGPYQ